MQANITPYFEPRVDDDGEVHCGIDVNFSDGSQLEFTLINTGWGSLMEAIAEMIAKRNSTTSRE